MQTASVSRRSSANRNVILAGAAVMAAMGMWGRRADAGLTHRYSFDGNLNDSVGTLNGTAGGSDATVFSNGTILFTGAPGAAGNYVLLPAGLLPNSATSSVTLESFGNYRDTGDWPRIFDFGSGQAVNFFLTPRAGGGTDVRVRIKTTQTNAETGPIATGAVLYGVDQTYTVVLDGVAKTLTLYRNGGLMGSAAITSSLDALAQTQNYLGKSQYPDANLGGAMDEFRVYDNALDQRQVIINHVLGSNTLTLSGTNSLTATGPTDWTNNAAWSNGAKPVKTEFVNVTNGGSVNITSNVGAVPFTVVSNGTINFNNNGQLYTGLDMAPGNTGSVTINLNAGSLLDTPRIFIDGGSGTNGTGTKIINFNGGTLHTDGQFTMQGTNLTTNINADTTFDTDFGVVTWGVPLTLSAGAQNALLTKKGVGTLSFPGGYNGRLSIETGTLIVGGNLPNTADLQLGRGTNGATLQFNAGVTVGGMIIVGDNAAGGTFAITGNANATSSIPKLQLNRSITINQVATTGANALNIGDINDGAPGGSDTLSRTLTFNNVGLVNVTGNITDPIAGIFFVKNNTGRTFLSGTNTFIGGTIVNTGILQYASPAAMGDFTFIDGTVVQVNANGIVAPGPAFGPIQSGLLSHIGSSSTGGVGLIGDSSENLSFSGLNGLFLGSIVANSTYTGTITTGGGAYRLGGGGGQITIPNTNQLTGNNALIVGGPAGGTGSVANTGGTVLLTGASNNYTGGTTLRANVTLQINDKAQIGTGGLGLNGGNLRITGTAPFNWTTPVELQGGTTTLTVDTTGGASFTAGFVPSNTNATTLIKFGAGAMNISGTVNVNAGNVHVDGGTLVAGQGTVLTTGAFGSVGRLSGQTGTLIVKDNAQYSVNGDFNISDLTNTVGYLYVQNTANLTPRTLYVGKGGTAQGIAVQSGGSVTSLAGPGDWRIGGGTGTGDNNSIGVYDLLAGNFSTTGNLQVGAFGQGTMYIAGGGTAGSTTGFPVVGRFTTGYGTLNVTNGSFTQGGTGQFMILGEQGTGILNVGGGTAAATVTVNGAQLRLGHTNTGTGFANLATNGTIQARAVNSALAGATGVLNFHGGSLKASVANTAFVSNLTGAYVWPEGGTIDSNGFDVTVSQPLVAPTGSGVSGVTVTTPGTGFVAHPMVKFVGGGGTGAAGIAITDANGTVTGVQITNPGVGYTSAPTVQILGGGAFGAGTAAATATLAANTASGGITKVGNGALTLSSPANTYAGPTVVNAGTLRVTGSVFNSSGVTVNSGAAFEAPVTQLVRTLTVTPGGGASAPNPATGRNVLTVGDGTSATSPLVLNSGANYGNLDIASNGLIVDVAAGGETSALSGIRNAAQSAYAAGAWTGNGLRSSSITGANRLSIGYALPADAPAVVTGGQFYGANADASSVVARVTIAGDSNLDSTVNFGDLLTLARNYNLTGKFWSQGDFDYNGTVNFNDLLILARNYNQSATPAPLPGASAEFNADMAAAFAAAVPEPGTAGILLAGAAMAMAGRRRRRQRQAAR